MERYRKISKMVTATKCVFRKKKREKEKRVKEWGRKRENKNSSTKIE